MPVARSRPRDWRSRKLKPRVDPRRFSLASVGDANQAVENATAAGKIVVDIAE
jgi:hypothetical protein